MLRVVLDTNVISEIRKKRKANPGVRQFFSSSARGDAKLYLSVITIGELRRGVELIRYRGDERQAVQLDRWLRSILEDYGENILDFTATEAGAA